MVTSYNALRNTYSGARRRTRTLSCGVHVALHLAAGWQMPSLGSSI